MSVDAQVATIRLVCAQVRSEVGTQLALGAELHMIANQVVGSWLGPDPFGLFLPSWTDGLALLNVDLKVPQTEPFRLAEIPLSHIASQVNALG